MFFPLLIILAAGSMPVDVLTKLTELLALHGVYALVVFFLFYQQRRTLRDFMAAKGGQGDYLRRVHQGAVIATYILIGIAIPVWVYATFFYGPKTVVWGNISNLTQMTGDPQAVGQVSISQQISPQQQSIRFYVNPEPDKTDPARTTLYWALVEDGQSIEIPLVFQHRVKELRPSNPRFSRDPNNPSKPELLNDVQRKVFVVKMNSWAAVQGTSLDYEYSPDAADPNHKIGKLSLLRKGVALPVEWVNFADMTPLHQSVPDSVPAWFRLVPVFAQDKSQNPGTRILRALPLLGSADFKQQLTAEQVLIAADAIPWDEVRKLLHDPRSTADRAMFIHNLGHIINSRQDKGTKAPVDIRLGVARESYQLGDFKIAAPLFGTLTDKELGVEVTNYYYRGVSNLQVGNHEAASEDLAKYVNKAPTPAAKAVAQRALSVANKAQNKN